MLTQIMIVSSQHTGMMPNDLAIVGANVMILGLGGIAFFVGLITLWAFRHRLRTSKREPLTVRTNPPSPLAPVGSLAHSSGRPEIQPVVLYFGKSDTESSVSISPLKAADLSGKRHAIDFSRTKLSENPLLQLVPAVLTAAEFGGDNYMRVLVNGPLALSLDARSFLPFVRGADGKVSELARLRDTGRLCEIVNTAMVWQFASVIVAQKHLADISKKMDEIKQGIEEIRAFLEAERASKIRGALRYW
jgi:hypothetical protein